MIQLVEYSQWKEVWAAKKKKDAAEDESNDEDEGYIFAILFELQLVWNLHF